MHQYSLTWTAICLLVLTVVAGLMSPRAPYQPRSPLSLPVNPLTPAAVDDLLPSTAPPVSRRTPGPARRGGINVDPTPTRTPTPINIGNFVWDDLDRDGRQDAGEPGIANVTVQLWNSAKTALLDSAVTSASGIYTVTAPVPGDYRVRVILPNANDEFSPKDGAGGDEQLDSDINPSGTSAGFTDIFTLASNVISTTVIDAGIIIYRPPTPTRTPTPINIGNLVWHDLNGNGLQDSGEPGVGGVTIQLWNDTKTALIHQTTTNSSGIYTLVAPLPGSYRIRVLLPVGSSFTSKDAGANDQQDSDVNPSGTNFGFTDIYTFASNVISVTTIDAGLLNVQPSPTATVTPVLQRRAYLPMVRR